MEKQRLNRAIIVATALEIADEKGLAAVTLRGIAARLGAHVTSLYNHVPTKEAVLDEMVKALVAQAKLPDGPLTWQEWVQQFAVAMRNLARKRPGAFEAFHHAPVQGDRSAETFEVAFAGFRADGFDALSSYNAVKATIVAVLGLALEETVRVRDPGLKTDLSKLSAERFPYLFEIGRVTGKADTFSYLIDALIAGFEANRQSGKSRPKKRVR